jgi:hypothetical protein
MDDGTGGKRPEPRTAKGLQFFWAVQGGRKIVKIEPGTFCLHGLAKVNNQVHRTYPRAPAMDTPAQCRLGLELQRLQESPVELPAV